MSLNYDEVSLKLARRVYNHKRDYCVLIPIERIILMEDSNKFPSSQCEVVTLEALSQCVNLFLQYQKKILLKHQE